MNKSLGLMLLLAAAIGSQGSAFAAPTTNECNDTVRELREKLATQEQEFSMLRNQLADLKAKMMASNELTGLCFGDTSSHSAILCSNLASDVRRLSKGNVFFSAECQIETVSDFQSVCYGTRWIMRSNARFIPANASLLLSDQQELNRSTF